MIFWQKRVYTVFEFYNLNVTYTFFKVDCINECSNFIIWIDEKKPFSQQQKRRKPHLRLYNLKTQKLIWVFIVVLTWDLRVCSSQIHFLNFGGRARKGEGEKEAPKLKTPMLGINYIVMEAHQPNTFPSYIFSRVNAVSYITCSCYSYLHKYSGMTKILMLEFNMLKNSKHLSQSTSP
jgi:hypothetical protein